MIVLAVVLATGLAAGSIAGVVAWHWPRADPTAPTVAPWTVAKDVREHSALRRVVRSRFDPGRATGLLLTAALVVVAAGIVAVGALLLMVDHDAGLARYDTSVARFGAAHATNVSTHVLRWLSYLGTLGAQIVIGATVVVVMHRRAPIRTAAAFFAATILGETLIANLTKELVNRPRPHVHRLTTFSGSSFPSGHAAAAAAAFAAAALVLGRARSRPTKAWLAAMAVGMTAAIAATRVMLGVHWTTDVIAGSALGWAWFAVCSIAFGGRVLRFGYPVSTASTAAAQPSVHEHTEAASR